MIVLIDNYDSFTFNLYQMIEDMDYRCRVIRNDVMTLTELIELNPTHLVISPGPGRPEEAGITLEAIQYFGGRIPILGICLGHQAIAHAFGGKVILAPKAFHGKCSSINHDGTGVFLDIQKKTTVARYHSLMVDEVSLPSEFKVTSHTADGIVMSLSHRSSPIVGLQFHPESYATPNGRQMLRNFFNQVAA